MIYRVPIALAVVPITLASLLFVVVGPILLLPIWGVALAMATLAYYDRRCGPCGVCGRGTEGVPSFSYKISEPDEEPNGILIKR